MLSMATCANSTRPWTRPNRSRWPKNSKGHRTKSLRNWKTSVPDTPFEFFLAFVFYCVRSVVRSRPLTLLYLVHFYCQLCYCSFFFLKFHIFYLFDFSFLYIIVFMAINNFFLTPFCFYFFNGLSLKVVCICVVSTANEKSWNYLSSSL